MPSRTALRPAIVALVLAAAAFTTEPASARPDFPATVASHLHMPCVPQCTICHIDNQGGFGRFRLVTVNGQSTGFGLQLKEKFGLMVTDFDVAHVLDEAAGGDGGTPLDVSQDGIPDVEELKMGKDPNDGADICGAGSAPVYGCVRVARQGEVDGLASAASATVLVVGIGLMRRRRSRRAR